MAFFTKYAGFLPSLKCSEHFSKQCIPKFIHFRYKVVHSVHIPKLWFFFWSSQLSSSHFYYPHLISSEQPTWASYQRDQAPQTKMNSHYSPDLHHPPRSVHCLSNCCSYILPLKLLSLLLTHLCTGGVHRSLVHGQEALIVPQCSWYFFLLPFCISVLQHL